MKRKLSTPFSGFGNLCGSRKPLALYRLSTPFSGFSIAVKMVAQLIFAFNPLFGIHRSTSTRRTWNRLDSFNPLFGIPFRVEYDEVPPCAFNPLFGILIVFLLILASTHSYLSTPFSGFQQLGSEFTPLQVDDFQPPFRDSGSTPKCFAAALIQPFNPLFGILCF